jgi:hypothetical protein
MVPVLVTPFGYLAVISVSAKSGIEVYAYLKVSVHNEYEVDVYVLT